MYVSPSRPLILLALLPACTHQQQWELAWSDEFEHAGLPDTTVWTYAVGGHGWGNQELQYYTDARPQNAFVRDGRLHLTAHHETYGSHSFTSARIISRGKKDFQYGRVEVSARLPEARGTWPAIWLMPSDWTYEQGGWPDVGEIDIMEHVGHNPGVVHSSAHSKRYQWQTDTQKTDSVMVADASSAIHTYVLEWSPKILQTYVDEVPVLTYRNENTGADAWPYDKPFYLILNIAIGGVWGGMVDTAAFPQTMEIEFVRVYRSANR